MEGARGASYRFLAGIRRGGGEYIAECSLAFARQVIEIGSRFKFRLFPFKSLRERGGRKRNESRG